MRGTKRLVVVAAIVVGLAAITGSGRSVTAAEEADQKKAEQKVTLKLVSPQEYEAIVKKQKGKVVLVDFWATWCVPCLKGFPKTLELGRELKDEGLVVISMSMDEPDEETREQVLQFLKDQKATIPNLMSRLGGESEAMEAFNIEGGALPHYKVYDRSGKLVKTIGVDFDNPSGDLHERVEEAVREALRRRARP